MALDDQDVELGRRPVRRAAMDPETARERLEAARAQRPRPTVPDDDPGPAEPATEAEAPGSGEAWPGVTEQRVAQALLTPPPVEDDDHQVEEIKARAGTAFRDTVEKLERGALRRLGTLKRRATRLETLTDAAEALIGELDQNHQEAIRMVGDDMGLPAWVVILGAVARLADLKELNAGEFNQEWLSKDARASEARKDTVAPTCMMCHLEIPNGRRGQQACCNAHGSGRPEHSPGCPLAEHVLFQGRWTKVRTVPI
jgi:hypothetical protein